MNRPMALSGVKVIDAATFMAGPFVGTYMADFGADVLKVEHPSGDAVRTLGWQKNGISLWWLLTNRNKRCVTLSLNKPQGQEIFKRLVADVDVVIENYRPGTMERWGLGYEDLRAINPRLIMVRISGCGQTGPYRKRPGFGTLGESMSGFAHLTGEPDGAPQLPSTALSDHTTGITTCVATMFALYHRDARGGEGQFIDSSLYESLFSLLGPQATAYDKLGIIPTRSGSRSPFGAPRNTYRCKDGRWLALSSSTLASAANVMEVVGRSDVVHLEWFQTPEGRVAHCDELDAMIGVWVGQHDSAEAMRVLGAADAEVTPVYSVADMLDDPHFKARQSIVGVEDSRFGVVQMQNVVPRLSETPGQLRTLGPALGEHNVDVYVEQLGYSQADLEAWWAEGII